MGFSPAAFTSYHLTVVQTFQHSVVDRPPGSAFRLFPDLLHKLGDIGNDIRFRIQLKPRLVCACFFQL